MGKRIIEELATDTIQDNDFILMDNNTTPTDPDDDTAGTRKIRASEFGAQIIPVDDELSPSSENPVQNKVITGAINDLASATEITGTASGSIASFDDGSTMPLKTLQVSIEPVQSGSGEPSPSNVRPISGWTECNIQRTGKNLIDASAVKVGYIYNRTQMDYQESSNWVSTDYIPVIEGKSYKFTYNNGTNGVISQLQGINKDKTSAEQLSASSGGFTVPSGIAYVIICTNNTSTKDNVATWQLEVGTTGSTYQAYTGNDVYTVAFTDGTNPLTVYGGTAKVFMDGGKWYCTVTTEKSLLTDSDMRSGVTVSSSTDSVVVYQITISDAKNDSWIIANRFSTQIPTGNAGRMVKGGRILYWVIAKSELSSYDASGCYDWFDTHPSQFLYNLATPTTTTFEIDTEIATLLGNNNIFADTGNVLACEYIKDTDIVIKKLLYKDLTATLSANATSLTITDSAITTDATYDIFTDTYGVSPTAVSVSNGSMTLTFTARTSATKVKVRVML